LVSKGRKFCSKLVTLVDRGMEKKFKFQLVSHLTLSLNFINYNQKSTFYTFLHMNCILDFDVVIYFTLN